MASTDTKKYYYLQFSDDFCSDPPVLRLKMMPGGKSVAYVYLEMMLLAGSTNGILEDTGIFPSFSEQISAQLKCISKEEVESALTYFTQYGYIKTSNSRYEFIQASKMTASRTGAAIRKRSYRRKNLPNTKKTLPSGDNVPQMSPPCPPTVPYNNNNSIETELELKKEQQHMKDKWLLLQSWNIVGHKKMELFSSKNFQQLSCEELGLLWETAEKNATQNPSGYFINLVLAGGKPPQALKKDGTLCPRCGGNGIDPEDENGDTVSKCRQCHGTGHILPSA